MTDDPLVSVVIPTSDAADDVGRCLGSVEAQTYDRVETVVVDAHSDDGTADVVRDHDAELVLSDDGMSEARNTGVEHASGSFLLSIDADMELMATVVERCLETYRAAEGVGGVVVPERSVGDGYWVAVRDFERRFYAGTAVESARFFPMDVVRRVGGYDEDVTFFEDSTLPQRIEARTGLDTTCRADDALILHHEGDASLRDLLARKHRYGRSLARYARRYDRSAAQLGLRSRLGAFLRDPRFYAKPHLAAGVFVLKALEALAAGTGVLLGDGR